MIELSDCGECGAKATKALGFIHWTHKPDCSAVVRAERDALAASVAPENAVRWAAKVAKLELELSELRARIAKVEVQRDFWEREMARWEDGSDAWRACSIRVSALNGALSILKGEE